MLQNRYKFKVHYLIFQRNENDSLTKVEKDKFTNIGVEKDFQESISGMKNAEGLVLSSVHDEIAQQERKKENSKTNADKNLNQSQIHAEITDPGTLISGQEALNDELVTLKADLKADNKETCVKENTSLIEAEEDLHCQHAKKVGTFKFTYDSDEKFETTLSSNKEPKVHESITEKGSGNPLDITKSQIKIIRHLDLEEEKVKDVGLLIPKIDIEKSIDCRGAVSVDPDEFSIELTQDEETLHADDTIFSNVSDEVHVSSKNVREFEFSKSGKDKSGQLDDSHEIDKAIEHNWELSDQHAKIFKPRAKKHKLSKETIKNQFQAFDMNKDKFQTSFSKEEIQPKQQKLAQISDCKRLPNKQRNYSSMFRIEETAAAEKVDKMQFGTKTKPQNEVNCLVSKEEIPCTSYDVCCENGSKYVLPFSSNSILNRECIAQDKKGLTTLQTVLPTISMTNLNNTSSPVFIAKPLINFANAGTVITSSLKQDNMLGQGQVKCLNTSHKDSFKAVGVIKNSGVSFSDNLSEVENIDSDSVTVKQSNTVAPIASAGVLSAASDSCVQKPLSDRTHIVKPVTVPLTTVVLTTSNPCTTDSGIYSKKFLYEIT